MIATFIKISVILFSNILEITLANFVDIYVYSMTEAQGISIIISWPCCDVVFTKKVAKKLENWDYGSF